MNKANKELSFKGKSYTYFAFISYKREDDKWAEWLQKKLHEFKNYLFNQPAVLEVQPTYDIQITRPQKQKKDSSVQISPKKEPKNFEVLKVANLRPISIE